MSSQSSPTPTPWPRSPSPTLLARLLLLTAVLSLLSSARADSPRPSFVPNTIPAGDFICRTVGQCEPCPASELSSPVCKLWGNRRPLECIPRRTTTTTPAADPHDPDAQLFPDPTSSLSSSSSPAATAPTYHRIDPAPAPAPPPLAKGTESELLAAGEAGDSYDLSSAPDEASEPGTGTKLSLSLEEAELQDALDHDRYRRRRTSLEGTTNARRQSSGVQRMVEAYEACPRVVRQEKADFFEFVLCNLFFACAALSVLVYRQRTLAGRQFGRLAARIMQTEVRGGGP
ncbi:hypothetical protein JCM5296_006598 [Sporobolomyces johnsonii]